MRMHTLLQAAAMALAWAVLADDDHVRRTFQIDLSALHTMKMQDWSGSATISDGKILTVQKTSGASDTIHPDMRWTIVYGRSLKGQPTVQPREKALLITVDAPPDAELSLKTKGGGFSFKVDDIPEKKSMEYLGGNVKVKIGKPSARQVRGGKAKPPVVPAKIAGELASEALTDGRLQSEWAAVSCSPDGTTWTVYVEWDGGKRDRVLARRRPAGGAWGDPVELVDGGSDHYWPAVVGLGDGAIAVWTAQSDGNAELYWSLLDGVGKATKAARLTDAPHTDFHARLVANDAATATLVWQSFRDQQSDVYAQRYASGTWSPAVRLSPSDANDWQPDVAVDGFGSTWVTWDSYHHGNYDVFLRRFDAKGPGPLIPVTSEPTAQFHSSVAVDARNRVWVAWDEACENWGKDLSTSSAAPGNNGLHASRSIGLRVYADGALHSSPTQPGTAFTGAMQRYAELPQLATDGKGTLWLVFRHWTTKRPTEMFDVYATKLTAEGWAMPWKLANSSGRNSQWTSVARAADGSLQVAYASDGRAPDNLPKDQVHALTYRAYIAALPLGDGMPEIELAEVELPDPVTRHTRRPRETFSVGGRTYTLLLGDCHRHTDIRGHSAVDGSIMDTFRYALDAGQLDFMGLGDHNEVFGGKWPDGLRDYQWWWTQKAVDLFTCPPTFVGLFSYEHSMASPGGHRNIIFLKRGAPLRMIDRGRTGPTEGDNQPPELWKWIQAEVLTQPGQKAVIVPHTFAAGPLASWDWPNAEFDCLLEMYQGCRGSYEKWGLPPGEKRGGTQTNKPGHFAQDALAKGNIYGFVSFSDHRSTHNSWACVWSETVTREGLLDAMLARRTYAATDEIVLKVVAGDANTVGQFMDATVEEPPTLKIDVRAPDEILRVDVVKDGQFIWTKTPASTTFQADFRDINVAAGTSYYYVRVFQRDPDKPDGDPEMAWSSPIFVRYK